MVISITNIKIKNIIMNERIELLIKLGMNRREAIMFCSGIYNEGVNNTKKVNDVENWREDYECVCFYDLLSDVNKVEFN